MANHRQANHRQANHRQLGQPSAGLATTGRTERNGMTTVAAETEEALAAAGAILANDHFVYVSGDHGSGWVDKDAVFPYIAVLDRLCALLAAAIRPMEAEVLCGPAIGGLITAQWTARHLGWTAVFAEHAPGAGGQPGQPLRGRFELRRGYDRLVAGQRVVVIDDIVNTGHSTRQTAAAVEAAGGQVVGAGALVTRGNAAPAALGVERFVYLLECDIPSWPAAECELCRQGVPVNTRYAHGADFLAAQQTASP
jgi:orotate phosphoribosyltransferase